MGLKARWVLVFLVVLALETFFLAAVEKADQTNIAVPNDNGTSSQQNITGRMQQYVGFYGTVAMEVRKTTAAGNILYNKTVSSGKLYFVKAGATPTAPFIAAQNDSTSDTAYGLSGYYVTGNHFVLNDSQTVCGLDANYLNTTDNYRVGIIRDSAASPNYFFGVDLSTKTSANGYGIVQYEIVVAKTSTYTNYDIWFDLE